MLWFLKRCGLVFYILSAGSCGAFAPSMAHEHQLGESITQAQTIEWLRQWARPKGDFQGIGHRTQSCCYISGTKQDCFAIKQVRYVDGVLEVFPDSEGHAEYDVWYPIKHGIAEDIQKDPRDSPDGRSYVCIQGQEAVCFVQGSGG